MKTLKEYGNVDNMAVFAGGNLLWPRSIDYLVEPGVEDYLIDDANPIWDQPGLQVYPLYCKGQAVGVLQDSDAGVMLYPDVYEYGVSSDGDLCDWQQYGYCSAPEVMAAVRAWMTAQNDSDEKKMIDGPIAECEGKVELCIDSHGDYVVQVRYDENSWTLESLPETNDPEDDPDLLINVEDGRVVYTNYGGEWEDVKQVPQSVVKRFRTHLQVWEESIAKFELHRMESEAKENAN